MTAPRVVVLAAAVVSAAAGCTSPPPIVSAPAASTIPLPAIAPVPTTNTAPDIAASILEEARHWAFRVRSVDCLATGSSFAVAGGIVTNRHVASGSTSVQMSTWDGTDFTATVTATSSGPDLALLNNSNAPSYTPPAPLAAADPLAGTAVWAAGYPEGNQLTITPGHVIDYINGNTIGVDGHVMEITNPIQPGNSGSALVDSSGTVVGVAFATRTLEGYGLAVPIHELTTFLASPGSQLVRSCAA